jgi:L-rhamnose mutarotase
MLEALSRAGWRNYSLFLRGDGLLVRYLETADFERARAEMAGTRAQALPAAVSIGLCKRLGEFRLLSPTWSFDTGITPKRDSLW